MNQLIRGTCKICGVRPSESNGRDKFGRQVFKPICGNCRKYPWTRYKSDLCEECGFIPVHPAQLDVHHVDGDKKNNDPSNLVTFCANCHRLIHFG